MRILLIVENINSATGICIQTVARAMRRKKHVVSILSRYESNEKTDGVSYYTMSTKSTIPVKVQILMNLYQWPIKNRSLIKEFIRVGTSIIEQEHINLVISAYNSIEALLAGISLKENNKSVKYVSYFLDALYKGQYLHFMPSFFSNYRALKMQKYILDHSDKMVIMRSVEEQELSSKLADYKGKIAVLDIPLLEQKEHRNMQMIHNETNKLKCVYMGSLPRNIRDPKYLLELFAKTEKAELFLYGTNGYPEYEKKYGNCDNIHFQGVVSREKVSEILMECDVAVNISNSISTMLPSKIFEYMSYDKYILSVSKGKIDPCSKYLDEYGKYMCINENEPIEDISERFDLWIDYAKEQRSQSYVGIKTSSFLYKNTPEAFVELMENSYESK